MKTSISQYSQALYAATDGKTQKEIDVSVDNFLALLRRKNQLKIISRIIEKFGQIYDEKNNLLEIEIISAGTISEDMEEKIAEFIKEKYGVQQVVAKKSIDEKIIGGFIVKSRNEIFDSSISNNIKRLKNHLINKQI